MTKHLIRDDINLTNCNLIENVYRKDIFDVELEKRESELIDLACRLHPSEFWSEEKKPGDMTLLETGLLRSRKRTPFGGSKCRFGGKSSRCHQNAIR